ncbi:MAG: hypothetical protein LC745_03480 [Planctomycetia bacterium]|nr:hypothetical protein [Planctomycetia bacterium]
MDSLSSRRRVSHAMEQFVPALGPGPWVVEPLGEGVQAEIFLIRSRDRRPAWRTAADLVLKLYKPSAPGHEGVAREEFESLSRLNARLDGRVIDGWKVHTPVPLFRGDRPPGLVMTRVPGRSLNSYLRGTVGADDEVLGSLAGAVIGALGCYWRGDQRIYGDIDFNNILCDPASRTLSFVDPGMPDREYLCEGVTRDWYPASRDLAYMLFDVAVSVKAFLGHRAARRRQKELVETMVLAFAGTTGAGPERDRLLAEIRACARTHLGRVRASWSPAGAWRLLLKPVASRNLDRAIDKLRAAAVGGRRSDPAVCPSAQEGAPCLADKAL